MNKYVAWWCLKVNDGLPKLIIIDSISTHLTEETIHLMHQWRIVVVIVPKWCTMYIRSFDVHVFSTFKHHNYGCAEAWIETNACRSKIKLTVVLSQILCTQLVWWVWSRTLQTVDPLASYLELGCMWKDDSLLRCPQFVMLLFWPDHSRLFDQ